MIAPHDQPVTLSRQEEKIEPLDLISFLQRQTDYPKIYWRDRSLSFEKIGWGSSLLLENIPKKIEGMEEVEFFLLQSFSEEEKKPSAWQGLPRQIFWLAENEIIKDSNGVRKIHNRSSSPKPYPPFESHFTSYKNEELMNTKGWQETPSQEKWQTLIQEALTLQKSSELQKVVLSRQSHKTLKDPICPFAALRHLKKHQNKTTVFFLQLSKDITFLGSTPEKLFEREGQNLYSEALAGTIKNGDTPSSQESLKLQREVEAVETYIERTLAPLSTKISKDKCFSLLPLNTITHLYKKISVELLPFCTDEDIIEALHPTPAVAGTRKDLALSYIREREDHDRGYYAGVIGWIGYNRADISVAIRSCLIRGREVFIYAGAGIVSGSDPSSEWQELERKTAQYKEFFCEH